MNKLLLFFKKYHVLMIGIILMILNIILFSFTHNLNVLPFKYYSMICGLLLLLEVISILLITRKKKVLVMIGYIFTLILIILNICGIYYVNVTDHFLDKAFNNDKREYTNTFYVLSLKESNYTLDTLNDSSLGYYEDTPNICQAIKELNSKYKVNSVSYEDIVDMFHKLGTDIQYMLIEKNLYTYIVEAEFTLYLEFNSLIA